MSKGILINGIITYIFFQNFFWVEQIEDRTLILVKVRCDNC